LLIFRCKESCLAARRLAVSISALYLKQRKWSICHSYQNSYNIHYTENKPNPRN